MKQNNYYFSLLIQDGESIGIIDSLVEHNYGDVCKYVVRMYSGFDLECDKNNFTNHTPYIGKGDVCIDTYNDWVLVHNNSVCGFYLLYRKAYQDEVDWLTQN